MNLSNSQVGNISGTTFVFTFKIKTIEGKRKVTGLISGMCKKHAKEEAIKIINDLSKYMEHVNSIKIVNIQRIDCDFLVVPKEESKYNHGPKNIKDFFEDLKKANGSFQEMIENLLKYESEKTLRDAVEDLKTTIKEDKE